MKNIHNKYYINNQKYSEFLNKHDPHDYFKYVYYINKFASKGRFLDVGCGVGTAISLLNRYKFTKKITSFGVEISKTSIDICKAKKINADLYDGKKIPYDNNTFSIVGSFNVLEHTDDPISFLEEKYRVLKKNGIYIIVCPNFFSISNSYHYYTSGIFNKFKNILLTLFNIIFKVTNFIKMNPTITKEIKPDYDAVNATNPVSILNWSKKKNMDLLFYSSQQKFISNRIINYLDKTVLKIFLGSTFIIFRKR